MPVASLRFAYPATQNVLATTVPNHIHPFAAAAASVAFSPVFAYPAIQNLLGNDCAKARVNLCVSKDSLCLPFQNIIDVNGSTSADAVGKVATVLNDKCPVSEPTVPGVKVCLMG